MTPLERLKEDARAEFEQFAQINELYLGASLPLGKFNAFLDAAIEKAHRAGREDEKARIIALAGGEPYIYIPNITDHETA